MSTRLPVIVGFGGYNAAGRSSGHQAHKRMIIDSLSQAERTSTIHSLAHLMGIAPESEHEVLRGTLVRKIETQLFDADKTPINRKLSLHPIAGQSTVFSVDGKDLPRPLPEGWRAEPLSEDSKTYLIEISESTEFFLNSRADLPVKAAGQLPSGFDPAKHYRSLHHPRGLQLSILAASDAVKSVGIPWSTIVQKVAQDQIGVFSSSVMSQLDATGFGGLMQARSRASRVTSKQLALGLNTMPADFINAYVLGSLGATGGVTGACATYLYNLNEAVEGIRTGRLHVALVGSAEAPILPEVIDGYSAMSALATDAELARLEGVHELTDEHYRQASRPFGNNCGFVIGESAQYTMLMSDELAMELGAQIYGAVPGVFVNADGFKKSISSPGAGNYITMAKAVGLARTLLGERSIQQRSFIQAHGSSTPQNRTTESRIFDRVAEAFGINNWPVTAIKAYVGHSLGPASGDQMASSLGVFASGWLPGIKTVTALASDVVADRLAMTLQDRQYAADQLDVAFLNSKGFGGNNASAVVFSPAITNAYLSRRFGQNSYLEFGRKQEDVEAAAKNYFAAADQGKLNPIYKFGEEMIDENRIRISTSELNLPNMDNPINLEDNLGFHDFR